MLETGSAKKLFGKFKNAYLAFLNLVSQHTDFKNGDLWVDFLKGPAAEFKNKKNEFEKNFSWTRTKNDYGQWLKFYEKVETPEIFSEENFQKFLTNYNSKNI